MPFVAITTTATPSLFGVARTANVRTVRTHRNGDDLALTGVRALNVVFFPSCSPMSELGMHMRMPVMWPVTQGSVRRQLIVSRSHTRTVLSAEAEKRVFER